MGEPPSHARIEGKPRSFWRGFGLGIVTLGLYFVYWGFVVFREVDAHEGRRHHALVYAAGVSVTLLQFVLVIAWVVQAEDVGDALDGIRRAPLLQVPHLADLPPALAAATVLGFADLGLTLAYFGLETRSLAAGQRRLGSASTVLPGAFAGLYLVATLPGWLSLHPAADLWALPVLMLAFAHLQSEINRYWGLVASQGPTRPERDLRSFAGTPGEPSSEPVGAAASLHEEI